MSQGINFSIYRYPYSLVVKDNNLIQSTSIEKKHLEHSMNKVLKSIKQNIYNKSSHSELAEIQEFFIESKKIGGISFTTFNEPSWKTTFIEFLNSQGINELNDISDSISPSYIMFIIEGKSLYILSGGYGSKYITNYIDRSFGVDLLPKLFRESDNKIKGFSNHNFSGNRQTSTHLNKNHTSIREEREIYAFYKELKIEVPMSFLVEELGIPYEESDNLQRLINIINKDSISLKIPMTFEEILVCIKKINNIYETSKAKYAMNYLLPTKQIGLKKSDIESQLLNLMKSSNYETFEITEHYNLDEHYEINKFCLISEDGKTKVVSYYSDFNLEFIFSEIFERRGVKRTKDNFEKILKKWSLRFFREDEEQLLIEVKLIDLITGHFEYKLNDTETNTVFLLNGEWLTFNDKYKEILDKEYKNFYDENEKQVKKLPVLNKVILNTEKDMKINETGFLEKINKPNLNNLMVVHPILINNIEIADIILWDTTTVYLISSKTTFNGSGSRDLLNQMQASITFYKSLVNRTDKIKLLKEYYKKVSENNHNGENHIKNKISEAEFISIFDKEPIFIGGFVEGFRRENAQVYSKILITDLNKSLKREYDANVLFINHLKKEV